MLPPAKGGKTGRPRTYELREVWNAVLYVAKNGCTWRALPHDFPPWPTLWQHFRRWRDGGVLDAVHEALRREVRVRSGRQPEPSAAVLDIFGDIQIVSQPDGTETVETPYGKV
ncbi:MAG: transposase [Acidobacteriota bacterium]|nr:transposase [Acidobacteriota bacterium]